VVAMKDFFSKIKAGIIQYFKTFEDNTISYLKINGIALLIILAAVIVLTVWLWPHEKQVDEKVYAKNTEMAKNFDEHTLEYKDKQLGLKQELQLKDIQSDRKGISFFHLLLFVPLLGIATAFLATLMQAIYTKLKFTDNLESSQRVLSAALFASAMISCVVFSLWYYKTYMLIQ
jgi:hypothetical protein